ncbi:MAG: aminopeptidase P family protein [Nitrospinae bacterium]|nr:aminopeptidase P family protein [Nitrospinota bacterium]
MWAKSEHEIPESQFQQRIARVREFVIQQGLSCVVAYSAPKVHQWGQTGHVGYLTNWSNLDRITDTMVVIPREGEPVLLVAGVEYMLEQISEVSWIRDVRLVGSPDLRAISSSYTPNIAGEEASTETRSFGKEINHILKDNGCDGLPIGISGIESMPVTIYRDLTSSIESGIAEIDDIVAKLRQIKTPEEMTIIKKVAAISDLSYQTMIEELEDGVWGYELTAEMDRTAKRSGADFVYHCMHTAPGGDLLAGKLSIKAHDCRLHKGDYINVNAYVVYKGYWIQSDRAGTIGKRLGSVASEAVDANLRVQDNVIEAIKPGLPIKELIRIGDEAAERFGYRIQGGRIGHGQGLDYSEQPFLIAGSEKILTPGNVFVLHVCLEIPGTNILINPIADLCHVTKDGVEVLNKFPREVFHV